MHTAKIAAPATLLALTITSWAQDELLFATTMGETLRMVYVEGGEFLMGAQSTNPQDENYYREAQQDEGPVHREQLPSFYISKYEVTLGLWPALILPFLKSYRTPTRRTAPLASKLAKVSAMPILRRLTSRSAFSQSSLRRPCSERESKNASASERTPPSPVRSYS